MKVELIQKEYVISQEEFCMMASYLGMECILGFDGKQMEIFDRRSFVLALHQMEREKIIMINSGYITILEPYLSLFQVIKEAEYALLIDTNTQELSNKCCYYRKDGRMVITENFIVKDNMLRLYFNQKRKFYNTLMEEGYLTWDRVRNNGKGETEQPLIRFKVWNLMSKMVMEEICLKSIRGTIWIEASGKQSLPIQRYEKNTLREMVEKEILL